MAMGHAYHDLILPIVWHRQRPVRRSSSRTRTQGGPASDDWEGKRGRYASSKIGRRHDGLAWPSVDRCTPGHVCTILLAACCFYRRVGCFQRSSAMKDPGFDTTSTTAQLVRAKGQYR
jgi:hypothetical protein